MAANRRSNFGSRTSDTSAPFGCCGSNMVRYARTRTSARAEAIERVSRVEQWMRRGGGRAGLMSGVCTEDLLNELVPVARVRGRAYDLQQTQQLLQPGHSGRV